MTQSPRFTPSLAASKIVALLDRFSLILLVVALTNRRHRDDGARAESAKRIPRLLG